MPARGEFADETRGRKGLVDDRIFQVEERALGLAGEIDIAVLVHADGVALVGHGVEPVGPGRAAPVGGEYQLEA